MNIVCTSTKRWSQVQCTTGTMYNRYNVHCTLYKERHSQLALHDMRVQCTHWAHILQSQWKQLDAVLSFQRWPQRALVEHKYPREVFNWRRERFDERCPPTVDKRTNIKMRQNWNETQQGCRRSNYEFWIDWISNSLDQWHLQLALQIRKGKFLGSCIILSHGLFPSDLVMHSCRGKSLHTIFLGLFKDLLIKNHPQLPS